MYIANSILTIIYLLASITFFITASILIMKVYETITIQVIGEEEEDVYRSN